MPGPRMWVTTLSISSTGGYPLEGYAPEITVPKGSQLIDGPVEARKAAREQLDKGADWIKVYMTHRSWVDAQGALVSQPTLTVDELKAIVDETHGWGRKVACHAYNGPGLQRALDGGCDSIEHGLEITDAQIAQMVKQGTWYVPTLQVYYTDWDPADTDAGKRDRKRVALHGVSFAKALHAGVKIAFGTDVGGFKWSEPIAEEFAREVEFGHDADAGHSIRHVARGRAARQARRDRSGGARSLCGSDRRGGRSAGGCQCAQDRAVRDEGRRGVQAVGRHALRRSRV